MIEARRRAAFHVPGEPLVVSSSPMECVERLAAMSELTGLPAEMLLSTPIVTTPIPRYPAQWADGHRRWAEVRPEAMWHPLMWLPKRVAHRYTLVSEPTPEAIAAGDTSGTRALESDDAWALRVCLEVSSAGLYDEEHGWLDVLSGAGLDIDDDADLARVQEWLEGADDPLLDGIDLTPLLLREQPDWGVGEAAAWLPTLRLMVWGTHSEALVENVDALGRAIDSGVETPDGGQGPISPDAAKAEALTLFLFARDVFQTVGEEEDAVWALLCSDLEAATDLAETRRLFEVARERLTMMAELFVPVLEEAGRVAGVEPGQFASQPADAAT